MKRLICWMAALAFAGAAAPVFADRDRDEGGHGHRGHRGGEYKEEYWDGDCKVERKWKKDGEYKEKYKCKGPSRYGNYPPPVYQEQGVVVQPPAIVIQPPPIVIR